MRRALVAEFLAWFLLHAADVALTQACLSAGVGREANPFVAAILGNPLAYAVVVLAGFAVYPGLVLLAEKLRAPRLARLAVSAYLIITKAWTVANNWLVLHTGHGLPMHPGMMLLTRLQVP